MLLRLAPPHRKNSQKSPLDTNKMPIGVVSPDNKDNMICASACFLVYAGGVDRSGNYLALHRPYLSRDAARHLTDVEFEAAQKDEMVKVREYLKNMEVDQYWIDRVMSTNSQDLAPSIEEIVLSKCTDDTAEVERKMDASKNLVFLVSI